MILTKKVEVKRLYEYTKKNGWYLVVTSLLAFVSTFFMDPSHFKSLSYPSGVIGTALAFLIGFRNNTAYNRWWEARKIWGKLVNDSRHFSLKTIGFLSNYWNKNLTEEVIQKAKERIVYRHIAFVWSVNKHLRKLEWESTVQPFISKEEFGMLQNETHIPFALLKYQALDIKSLHEQGFIDDFRHMSFDGILENFNDALGKSERIKNTVFPMQYNWYMQYAIWVFLLILPFGLVGNMGLWFPPVAILVGYVFILLEYLGRQIENPFENHPGDTPMDSLSRVIEINLRSALGETDLPPKVEPREGKFLF